MCRAATVSPPQLNSDAKAMQHDTARPSPPCAHLQGLAPLGAPVGRYYPAVTTHGGPWGSCAHSAQLLKEGVQQGRLLCSLPWRSTKLGASHSDSLHLSMTMSELMPEFTCTSTALQTSYTHTQHPKTTTDCTAGQLSSPATRRGSERLLTSNSGCTPDLPVVQSGRAGVNPGSGRLGGA